MSGMGCNEICIIDIISRRIHSHKDFCVKLPYDYKNLVWILAGSRDQETSTPSICHQPLITKPTSLEGDFTNPNYVKMGKNQHIS